MEKIVNVHNISEFNAANNHKTLHPLVTVIDYSKANPRDWGDVESIKFQYGLYSVILKDVVCGDMKYGRHYYDYQAGTLVFYAPGQYVSMENPKVVYQPMGFGLLFHPDFLIGTHLGKMISQYKFFDYQTHEALHLSDDERQLILDIFAKIEFELKQPIDKHSKKLIASNIELFLDYCQRFYDRQFITRDVAHKGILERFEGLLNTIKTEVTKVTMLVQVKTEADVEAVDLDEVRHDSFPGSFGTFWWKSVARWNAAPILTSMASSKERPTICMPTGRPALVKPEGTESDGRPG